MPKLNAKMKRMKADLILDKASEMFDSVGFEELKVSELAKEVGVSVGTIYSYFESKEGLHQACMKNDIEDFYEALVILMDEHTDFEKMLLITTNMKFEIMKQKRVCIQSSALSNPFFFESTQVLHKESMAKIYELFAQKVEVEKNIDIESIQLVYLFNSMTNAYVLRWLEDEISLDGKAEEICNLFIKMIKG